MSREEMMDLLLGVAVVALGYALYKRHQAAQGNVAPSPGAAPITGIPAAPEVYQDAAGNYVFDMDRLFEGVL
jgi:hypothetical protein